jgi:hypothetical protein
MNRVSDPQASWAAAVVFAYSALFMLGALYLTMVLALEAVFEDRDQAKAEAANKETGAGK